MRKTILILMALGGVAGLLIFFRQSLSPRRGDVTSRLAALPPSPLPTTIVHTVAFVAVPVVSNNPGSPMPTEASVVSARPPSRAGTVAYFADTRIPFSMRVADLMTLGRKGDAVSIQLLMDVGNAQIYANRYAIEALGLCRGPNVSAYLAGKLRDPDALLAMAAIQSLGQVAASAAIPALTEALVANRVRPDGHQEMVCTADVNALRLTASAQAAPALIAELQRVDQPNWSLEYGSAVIAALRNMDSAEGTRQIAVYADALAAHLPTERMARAYYERKIAEARGTSRMAP